MHGKTSPPSSEQTNSHGSWRIPESVSQHPQLRHLMVAWPYSTRALLHASRDKDGASRQQKQLVNKQEIIMFCEVQLHFELWPFHNNVLLTCLVLESTAIVPLYTAFSYLSAISIYTYNLTHCFTTVIVRLHLHIRIDVDGKWIFMYCIICAYIIL